MTTDTQPSQTDHGPLRRIIGSISSMLQTRLELIGIEIAEERDRLVAVLFFGLAALMLTAIVLMALTVLVAVIFWDTWRWQALALITVLYAVAALLCAWRARSALRGTSTMFEATLDEFEKDRELFHKP